MTRWTTVAWKVAFAVSAAMFGYIASTLGDTEIPGFRRAGADGYIANTFLLLSAVLALMSAAAVSSVVREESSGRLDNLLVRSVTRQRWLVGRMGLAVAGLTGCGLVAGIALDAMTAGSDIGLAFASAMAVGVNLIPLAVLVLGIGILAFAAQPRFAVALTYGLVATSFVLEMVGSVLDAPEWILGLSMFHHTARLPMNDPLWGVAGAYLLLGALAGAIGVQLFRRRDLAAA
jgi:ABC-2 type transport system permease protein